MNEERLPQLRPHIPYPRFKQRASGWLEPLINLLVMLAKASIHFRVAPTTFSRGGRGYCLRQKTYLFFCRLSQTCPIAPAGTARYHSDAASVSVPRVCKRVLEEAAICSTARSSSYSASARVLCRLFKCARNSVSVAIRTARST